MAKDDKVIKDAQYRKGLSIGWFNANNAAVEMVKLEGPQFRKKKSKTASKKKLDTHEQIPLEERLEYWKTYFLEAHKEYYGTVIANVGGNYDGKASIGKLEAATSYENLNEIWISLSEDERHDPEIRKVAKELKAKFHEKA